jgi:hypothetical protein
MPFSIRQAGDKWEVINSDTEEVKGSHDSEEEAKGQLAALYANVEDVQKGIKMQPLFIPIQKIDERRHEIFGWGAVEERDNSDEVMDYASSKPLFMDWSNKAQKRSGGKSMGNVRAMHQPIAAGKLIDMRADDSAKGFFIGAKIIDDNEWKKVESGVYTGFSVGGSYERRWSDFTQPGVTRYTAKPTEISIVDAPCIPSATFQVIKADGLIEERQFKPGTGNLLKLDEEGDMEKLDITGDSMENIKRAFTQALATRFPMPNPSGQAVAMPSGGSEFWIEDIKQNHVIASKGDKKYQIFFTMDAKQEPIFEEPVEVIEERNYIPVSAKTDTEEGGLVNKLDAIKSLATDLLKAIDTLQKADIPAAPEEIASIPLPSGVGPDYEVDHMPEPNATMALEMDGQPAQEVLAAHTVVTKDLSAAFDAWLPKVGLMFKAMIVEAIGTVQKSDSSNPAGQKIAVTNRNIKVTRKEN